MSYRRCMYPDEYVPQVVGGIAARGYRPSSYHHREMDDYRHGPRNPMYRTLRPHMPPPSYSYPHDCPPCRESYASPRRRHMSRSHSSGYMPGHFSPGQHGMGMPPMGGYFPDYDVVDPYVQQPRYSSRRPHHGFGYGH